MRCEPSDPSIENYTQAWVACLKDYIASRGGVDRAALKLHIDDPKNWTAKRP